ncbi:MAG: hypothetical protein FJ011_18975 [Chloroflexi bacterium]|nr:hypothetical protein [Chloroflexota bacterium]
MRQIGRARSQDLGAVQLAYCYRLSRESAFKTPPSPSRFHPHLLVTLSPHHPVTLSPCHPITLSPHHPSTTSM